MALNKLVLALLLFLAPSAVYAFVSAGHVVRVATLRGQLVAATAGAGSQLAWIEQDEAEARLMVLPRPGGKPRAALRAVSLSGLAVSSGAVFVTRAEGPRRRPTSVSLLRAELAGGEPESLAALSWPASDLAVGNDYVCWREHHPSPLPGIDFVSAAAPVDVIRAQALGGGETIELPAALRLPEGAPDDISLLGVRESSVYWVEYRDDARGSETVIRRVGLPGGEPEALARERGRRSAILNEDALLWTAPSVEAGAERGFGSVKRLLLDQSRANVIADWLEPSGRLEASDGTIYVRERSKLWALGGARGEQRATSRWLPSAVAYRIAGPEEYAFVRTPAGLELVARPLNWRARLSRILGR